MFTYSKYSDLRQVAVTEALSELYLEVQDELRETYNHKELLLNIHRMFTREDYVYNMWKSRPQVSAEEILVSYEVKNEVQKFYEKVLDILRDGFNPSNGIQITEVWSKAIGIS